ncbi:hypothetical protein ABZ568_30875 [Streptomyces olindensis]|uniref:Uncharacterized protein n=1 Tax=Streptomyces olindensis TaxID=358823 RepID=A0ABV2Y392_9ACTN
MLGKPWFEFTPQERDDANRLGFLFETLQNDMHLGLDTDHFVMVLSDALDSEFAARADGAYPPVGHDYPRLES